MDNGKTVTCHVDNSALSKLLQQQFTCPRQWRWCQVLGRLPIQLVWVKGELNPADAFTRQDLHSLYGWDLSSLDTTGPCVPPMKLVDEDAKALWLKAYKASRDYATLLGIVQGTRDSPSAGE